jgi:hypothetical protein
MRVGLADLHHRKSVSAGKRVNADVYQELLRPHVIPWVQRTYPDRKYVFHRISTSPHCQDYPAVFGRILDSSGFAAIFTRLEFSGLLYMAHFAGKRPGDASCKSD